MFDQINHITLATDKKIRAIFKNNADPFDDYQGRWDTFDIILFAQYNDYLDVTPRLVGFISYNGKLMPCESIVGRDFVGYLTEDFVTPAWLEQQGRDEYGTKVKVLVEE